MEALLTINNVFKQSFELAWEAAEKHHNKIMGENEI